MKSKLLIVLAFLVGLGCGLVYSFWEQITYAALNAQDHVQVMQEIEVVPNVTTAQKAFIPKHYGKVIGMENVGKATMMWLEAANGTIRRVQVSFWEDEIILDDKVVVIERR